MKSVLAVLLSTAASAPAVELFSEGFDAAASAKVESNTGSGMIVSYEDYSAMTVGAIVHNIPEAPRPVAGSAPTRGVLMRVDYPANPGIAQRVANLVALNPEGARLALTDNYRLKFDFYLRLSPGVTLSGGIPTQAGTTEQMVWGVGYGSTTPLGRGTRSGAGTGTWGWLATEGGFSAANGSDASICNGTTIVSGRNMDGSGADTSTYFAPAFGADATPVPNCPANQWVEAEITAQGGQVAVQYKAAGRTATKFYENIPGTVGGGVMAGYEDSSASISFDPDNQWMLLDNMVVEDLVAPTLVVTAGAALPTYLGTPVTTTYTLQNTRAAGDLTVSAINFSGANPADFSVATTLPLVIGAGGSAPLVISFAPAAPNGVKSASFTIVSDDPQVPAYLVNGLRARRSVGSFLEAHYLLDEPAGTSLTDSSGNGETGALQVRESPGYGNPSLLGAADTGFSMGLLPAQTSTTGCYFTSPVVHTPTFSISFWMKPAATGKVRTLFQRDYDFATTTEKICGLLLSTEGALTYRVRSTDILVSAPVVTDGSVYHVVLTHLDEDGFGNDSATRARLYINGRRVAATEGQGTAGFDDYPLNPAAKDLHVGSRTVAGAGFSGDMDDVRVFGAELSREQVWELFRQPGLGVSPQFSILNAVFSAQPASFTVTVPSSPDGSYRLFRSGDLQTWNPVGAGVPGSAEGLFTELVDPAPAGLSQYYRVERQ